MRLIDADELFKDFEKSVWFINADRDDVAEELLRNAPTIDAKPVRHGHWINRRSSVYCSRCGKGYRNGVGTISAANHNYCPNCGAKMDEEDNT